jgi:hypothetical protein
MAARRESRSFVRVIVLAAVLASATARADGAYPTTGKTFHTGLDLRSDLGTHQVRLATGLRSCVWDTTLVLDPMFGFDGEHDLDLLIERLLAGGRLAVLAGWRWSAVAVASGFHHQQRSVLGVTAAFPDLADGRFRSRVSLELATLWVKHGGGVGADWISLDRNFLDHVAFGLFVRIEYASRL